MKSLILIPYTGEVSRQIEINVEDGVRTLSLRYIGEQWASKWRDVVGGSLDDDGNNFTLRMNGRKPITLDYSQAFEAMILLTEMFKKTEPKSIPPYEVYIRE